jgi:hypothetical protein
MPYFGSFIKCVFTRLIILNYMISVPSQEMFWSNVLLELFDFIVFFTRLGPDLVLIAHENSKIIRNLKKIQCPP